MTLFIAVANSVDSVLFFLLFLSANFMLCATTKKCLDMRFAVQLDYPINLRTSALARVILGTTARGHDKVTYSE